MRQTDQYVQDLDMLKDTAEDLIAEMNRLNEVDDNNNNLVEETVVYEDLNIPDAVVQLGAEPETSTSVTSAVCNVTDSISGASQLQEE